MNDAAYHAILRRLGVEPSAPVPTPSAEVDGPLAVRVAAFRDQIQAWTSTGESGVPLLTLPGAALIQGACAGCGADLAAESTWRCPVCVAAVQLVLGLPAEGGR